MQMTTTQMYIEEQLLKRIDHSITQIGSDVRIYGLRVSPRLSDGMSDGCGLFVSTEEKS